MKKYVLLVLFVLCRSAHAVGTSALSIDPDTGALIFDPDGVQYANWSASQFKIGGTQLVATGKTVQFLRTLTLTGVDGKTLTINNSLGFTGTDGTVMTFPTTNATIARTDAPQTFTGTQTFGAIIGTTFNKLTLTQPATGATITIVDGKTFTASNSIGLAGTDGKVLTLNQNLTFTGASGKALTLTGNATFGSDTTINGGGFAGTIPATGTFGMGAGTITVLSSNDVTGANHTHAITNSSNPGAAASILATNASGYLQLVRLGIGVTPTQPLHVAGNAFIDAATANLFMKDTSTGFQVSSTGVITPQSGNAFRTSSYTSGLVGWNIDNQGNAEFDNVDIRGAIHAGIITYNQIQTTAGTFLVAKSAAKLKTDVVVPSSPTYTTTTVNIDVVDPDGIAHASSQLFAIADILRLKDGLVGDTWFTVSSASDQTTFWRYVCTIQAGSNNVTYRAGLGVADFGSSGKGFITITADQTNAPYLQMATHAGTFTSANSSGTLVVTPQLRLGNLNGSFGYATEIYGLGAGQYGTASKDWFTIDQTNGFRIGNNTTVRLQLAIDGSGFVANSHIAWDTSGNLTIDGNATIAGWTVNSSYFAKDTGTNATSAGMAPADYPFFAGSTYANRATAPFRVTPAGGLTATSGAIGGWILGSTRISSTNVFLDQSGQYISMGASPPTSYGSNTGIYIEGTNSGRMSLYKDASHFLQWDSNKLLVQTDTFSLDSSGNATLGQVATNKANVYWNASNNRLEFRGGSSGTAVQSYIDVDGSLTFQGATQIQFRTSGGTLLGQLGAYSPTSPNIGVTALLPASQSTSSAQAYINASNDGALGSFVNAIAFGSAHATRANQNYVYISGSGGGFQGLAVGNSVTVPTHMLDIYGNAWFQGNLYSAGKFLINSTTGDGTSNVWIHTAASHNLRIYDGTGPILEGVNADSPSANVDLQFKQLDRKERGSGAVQHLRRRHACYRCFRQHHRLLR
jgi:hypothetical protein